MGMIWIVAIRNLIYQMKKEIIRLTVMKESYIRKWGSFTNERKISVIQVPVDQVLKFLTKLYDLGLGYCALNTSRSSLSALAISSDVL